MTVSDVTFAPLILATEAELDADVDEGDSFEGVDVISVDEVDVISLDEGNVIVVDVTDVAVVEEEEQTEEGMSELGCKDQLDCERELFSVERNPDVLIVSSRL